GNGTGRKSGEQGVDSVKPRPEIAFDMADNMHHMTIAFDDELLGDLHASIHGNPANIISTQIKQHKMFCALLGVSKEVFGPAGILYRISAAWARSRDGPNGYTSFA